MSGYDGLYDDDDRHDAQLAAGRALRAQLESGAGLLRAQAHLRIVKAPQEKVERAIESALAGCPPEMISAALERDLEAEREHVKERLRVRMDDLDRAIAGRE